MSLSGLDYGILAAVFTIMLVLGLTASRLARKSLEHYFLGGRNLPWYLLGVSGMSGWFDMTGTMLITSFLFLMGPRGLYIEFRGGAVLVLAFMLAYVNKWGRRSGCMTSAEWNVFRFGVGPSAKLIRISTAVVGVLVSIGALAMFVRGATLFVGVLFPVNSTLLTVGLFVLATSYTAAAGFYGVVLTDLLQGLIMIAGAVAVSVIAWKSVPNVGALAAIAQHVTGNPHWTRAAPSWIVAVPKAYEAYHYLALSALFYLVRNVLGANASFSPLAFAARNPREASLMCVVQGFTIMFRWPLMIGLAILGLLLVSRINPPPSALSHAAQAIHAAEPGLQASDWQAYTARLVRHPEAAPTQLRSNLERILGPQWPTEIMLLGHGGVINPELIAPEVLLSSLGPGLRGLLVAALLAALLGAVASPINAASALVVRDIYQAFIRPKAGRRELIGSAYISSIGIVAIAIAMGLRAQSINDLWGWTVMSLMAGALGPGVLGLLWWRTNAWGVFCGNLLGGAGAIVQRWLYPSMPEWWQFVAMATLSFAATLAGSLLTRPIPPAVVGTYYRMTRPFGCWGPFWKQLPDRLRIDWRREHRNDGISAVLALVAQVFLFLVPMEFLSHNYTALRDSLPVFLAALVGLYFFWWKNLPAADDQTADFVGHPPVHSVEDLNAAERV